MRKRDQIVEVLPGASFKIWCDGQMVVFKDNEDKPFASRCFNKGCKKVTIRAKEPK